MHWHEDLENGICLSCRHEMEIERLNSKIRKQKAIISRLVMKLKEQRSR